MRVLISAYACAPGAGSELGKGWNFVYELARQGHEVVVLTCGSHHREAIERYRESQALPPGLSFVWHDVPGWPGPGYENARYIRQHYLAWQVTARKVVSRLNVVRRFDVIHHLSWAVLRWPSFLGGLGTRFVFGPVGGGQSAPWALRHGFPRRGWKAEVQRDLINLWSRIDPLVLQCLKHADVVLVTDEATRRHIPRCWWGKTSIVSDVYVPDHMIRTDRARKFIGEKPAILLVARLEYWKGIHLAIGAITGLRRRCPRLSLTIAGTGPEAADLHALAERLAVEDSIRFVGHIPHANIKEIYEAHDIFIFPSLHDSGGIAIGEALAYGLPVVCLDLGGPPVAVDDRCGIVVSTSGKDRIIVEQDLADALLRIIADPDLLARLQNGACARARELSYRQRVLEFVEAFYYLDSRHSKEIKNIRGRDRYDADLLA